MSRIAGIVGPWGSGTLHPMLEAMRGQVAVQPAIRAANDAHLGAIDWRAPNVAQDGALTVVLDAQMWTATAVLELIRKHGFVDALAHIDGDFAIAAYDTSSSTLWLARDRFAIKPLYFARTREGFAFASRTRALLAFPGVTTAPNQGFVARFAGLHYRTFDNLPNESPYADIAQLPAATWMSIRGSDVREGTYWSLTQQPDLDLSEADLATRYRELLLDAVSRRRKIANKPAFTLSGGMDSSSVIACSVHTTGQKEHAFSTVYHDVTYDETAEIRTILEPTVEEWHAIKIGDPVLGDLIPKMIAANDEPIATATWLSHYLLCEATNKAGFGTLFGGLGGDELNAGEYEYFFYFFADLAAAHQEKLLQHETAKWAEYHDHPIFKKNEAVMRAGLERLVDLKTPGRCLPDPARLARYRDFVRPDFYDLTSYVPVMDEPFTSYLKNRTYQDIFRETAPCCLRAADRQTSAFGIDVSWPFFDHRLAELMFRVPATLKIRDGVTKHLLRDAMTGIVPEATRTRIAKTGWNAPAHVWFATGSGRDLVLDLTASRGFIERGIYDVARVRALLDEHRDIVVSGRPVDNHMMFFWQLVNLELWLTTL
ncbi:MAG TPA: asparagine synthase-related protein [Kofleriaceae bacterium]|jgi:asparagine synthase (glutamine-hydrolysing)